MMKKMIVACCSFLIANSLSARIPDTVLQELDQIEALQQSLDERAEFLRTEYFAPERANPRAVAPADRFKDDVGPASRRRDALRVDEARMSQSSVNYVNPDGYINSFKALFAADSNAEILDLPFIWDKYSEDDKNQVLKTFSTIMQGSTDWAQKNEIVYEYASLEDGKFFINMLKDMDRVSKHIRSNLKEFSLKLTDRDKIPTIHIAKQQKNGEFPIRVELFVPDNKGKGNRDAYNFTFILKPAPGLGSTVMALLH